MPELAYINGVFCPISEAKVSIDDRGFQFGDGIYEVIFAYGGKLFLLGPHMQRLRRSAASIELSYDFDAQPLEPIIEEGLRRCELRDAMIYLQMTRGVAPRLHQFRDDATPTIVMTFRPRPVFPDDLHARGIKVVTVTDQRWANCSIKAITLLPNVLAKTRAMRYGYHDAIFVTSTREVRECTSANIFMAKDGRLRIPPRTVSILHGITQAFLMECAAAIELPVDEQAFDVETLYEADEVFMSSTAVEVLGIVEIDDRPIADGRVGPITRKLATEFQRRSRAQAS